MDFGDFARIRSFVREQTVRHVPSVLYFARGEHSSFVKTVEEPTSGEDDPQAPVDEEPDDDGQPDPAQPQLHGITTTFTCVESLMEATEAEVDGEKTGVEHAQGVLDDFVPFALGLPDQWRSEGSARVYCRVRGLAPLLALYGEKLTPEQKAIAEGLLEFAWEQVEVGSATEGIYEFYGEDPARNRYPLTRS